MTSKTILTGLLAYAARLRFPTLAMVTTVLFVLDVFIPDALPFADEILLGLATALFTSWRREKKGETGEVAGSKAG